MVTERVTVGDLGLPDCLCTPAALWLEKDAKPETLRHRSLISPLGKVPYMLPA